MTTGCLSFHTVAQHQISVQIAVDTQDLDDITRTIVAGSFSFPDHFYLLPALLPRGGRVLDLGAHCGTFSLFAAALGYDVVAIEASPALAGLLTASAQRNQFGNMQVVHCAVSDRPGSASFIPSGPYGIVANPYIDGETVVLEAKTVHQLANELDWVTIDFVKLDVEGSEIAALAGMSELLASPLAPIILYESNAHTLGLLGHTPREAVEVLERFDYQVYFVLGRRLAALAPGAIQPTINMECLALKRSLAHVSPSGWHVTSPLTRRETARLIWQELFHSHPHNRAYARSMLKDRLLHLLSGPLSI